MRFLAALFLLLLTPGHALAQVALTFHSFNGSVFGGRYPHTFISLEGTLEDTGEPVRENFGYTAVKVSPAILSGSVAGKISSEEDRYVSSTNRHFTLRLSDAQYRAIREEIARWASEGGKQYNLNSRNCVHFVARIAIMAGLSADVPANMVKRPKAWLNYITRRNPQIGAAEID
jgi:hypothetical protein